LSIVGEALILPYYYFQNETLWPPIFWGAAFMIVNAAHIVAMPLERRPVVLSDKEEQLYRVAFSSIDKREFLRLASLARWADRPAMFTSAARPLNSTPCPPSGGYIEQGFDRKLQQKSASQGLSGLCEGPWTSSTSEIGTGGPSAHGNGPSDM
jgi:hypothetical protein